MILCENDAISIVDVPIYLVVFIFKYIKAAGPWPVLSKITILFRV